MIGVSRVKVTHLETAARRPDIGDVMSILTQLQVTGKRFDELIRVARDATDRGWWEERQFRGMGHRQAFYANLEYGARGIREYAPTFLPGLLQTEEYIRSRNSAVPENEQVGWNVGAATLGRLERQRVFNDTGGPQFDVIAEEIALGRITAPPKVMANQLQHLIDVCTEHERVTLRVLPVGVEMLQPLLPSTTFYMYTYPAADDPTVVSVEAVHKDIPLTDPDDVTSYERLWERLDDAALSQTRTVNLLARTIKQLTR